MQRLSDSARTPQPTSDDGDLDRLGERFRGFNGHLVRTNLTGAERSLLLETFD